NYGGWTNGLRWLMWLSPLWLLMMLPVAGELAERRWARGPGIALLVLSLVSVTFFNLNPLRHPRPFRALGGFVRPGEWTPLMDCIARASLTHSHSHTPRDKNGLHCARTFYTQPPPTPPELQIDCVRNQRLMMAFSLRPSASIRSLQPLRAAA